MLLGGAGIGKSSSMRILASDWASSENRSNRCHRLNQFNFLFLVELGYVNCSQNEAQSFDDYIDKWQPSKKIVIHVIT